MKKLTIYSWGYWGWGTHADRFVKVVDCVEASRGYKPPIFVDIRIRRSVRATDFKENAFCDLIGNKRYRWFKGLGNVAIIDKSLDQITIKNPKEAITLLALALEAKKQNRRVIYYCACETPLSCHRFQVGTLLLKEAKRRGISLEVVEWPGGIRGMIKEKTSTSIIKKIQNGQANYPLAKNIDLSKYGALSWGTLVTLSASTETYTFISGPVRYIKNNWSLPVVLSPVSEQNISNLRHVATHYLEEDYGPRKAK
jgi:hypothetical protein